MKQGNSQRSFFLDSIGVRKQGNPRTRRNPRQLLILAVAVGSGVMAAQARAASASWISTSTDSWGDGAAWSTGVAPGATSGTSSSDIATFNSAAPVSITGFGNPRIVQSIVFSSPAGYGNNYSFQNSGTLYLSASGGLTADSTYQGVAYFYTSSAPTLEGSASFNSSGGWTSGLYVGSGGVAESTAASLGNVTLTLTGSNTGLQNIANDNIGSGSGTTLTLAKTGAGTWSIGGTNTFTGGVNLSGGTLITTSAGALGSGTINVLSNSTLRMNSATDISSRINIADGQTFTLNTNNVAETWASAFANSGSANNASFAKSGLGVLTLTGAQTYNGSTSVIAGELSVNGTAGNIVISPGSSLNLAGGVLNVRNTSAGANTVAFNGTTLSPGVSLFVPTGSSGTNIVDFGTFNRTTGSLLNITTATGYTFKATGSANDAGNLLPGVIYNQNDFATLNSSNGIAATTYTTDNNAGDWSSPTANYATNGALTGNTIGTGAGTNINALKISGAANQNLTINGTLAVNDGILFASGIGNNQSQISGGTITAGSPNGNLVIVNSNAQSTTGVNTISSVIADPTSGSTNLVVYSTTNNGSLLISGNSTYTGNTYVGGGSNFTGNTGYVTVGGAAGASIGSAGKTVYINGGNGGTQSVLRIGNGDTFGDVKGTIEVDNGTLSLNRTDTYTVSASISGVTGAGYITVANTGTATLNFASGNNLFYGITGSAAGTLNLQGANSNNTFLTGSTFNASQTTNFISGNYFFAAPANSGSNAIGNLNVQGANVSFGSMRFFTASAATINVSSGSLTSNGQFNIGDYSAGKTVVFNVTGTGLLDIASNSQNIDLGANAATGSVTTLNVNGGTFQYGLAGESQFGPQNFNIGPTTAGGSARASLNLLSGTARVYGTIQGGGAPGAGGSNNFNFTGGTLTAAAVNLTNLSSNGTSGTLFQYNSSAASFLAPGDNYNGITFTGKTSITGNYQLAGGAINIGIGGTTPAAGFHDLSSKYDNIAVTGGFSVVNGLLDVSLLNNFAPSPADSYTILTSGGTINGAFTNVASGGTLTPVGGRGTFTVTYSGNNVVLSNYSIPTIQWQGSSGGLWTTNSNWTGNVVPQVAGDSATFGSLDAAAGNVNLNSNETVGILTFNNSNSYTVTGSGTLTLDNAGQQASVSVIQGSHTINVPVAMNASTSVSFSSGTSLTFAGSISGAGTRTLAFNGTGTATLTGSNTYTGPTTVGAGATLQLGDGTTAAHDPTLATSGITVSNTSTVAFNTVTGTYNVNYPISGAGQIVKNGSNTLNLTVANAFNTTGSTHSSQGVQINAGTVNLGAVYAANASSNSVINVGAGANVTESVTNALSGFSGINLGTPTSSATLNYNNNTGFYSAINGGNLTLGAGGALGTALLFLGYGTLTADADLTGANAITTPVHLNGGGDPTAGSSTILPGHNITFNCSVGTVSNYANDYFTQSDSPQVWNIDNALTTIQCPVRLGLRTSSPFNPAGYGNLVITGSISNYNTNAGYVGSLLYSGTGTLSLSGANSFTGGAQINSGTLVLQNSNAIPTGTSLTVNSPGKVSVNNSGGSKLIVTVSSLTNTGQIDLQNNDMVIQGAGASIGTYFSQLQSGYNNGNWNGTSGIVSSTAAGSSLYTLGIATGLSSGVDGSGSGDVVIKYTYYGDALLTGSVTTADYTQIDNGFLSGTATGWQNGDFNYDGVINGSDYTLIDNAFNTQGANIATQFASPTAQLAGAGTTSAVPEPTTLGLLALAATGLLGRRRSRVR